MSVYIKNMEMPTSCYDCPLAMQDYTTLYGNSFKQTRNSYACVLTHKAITSTKRNRFCPLVPVPPHGRLIDADEFFKALTMDDCVSILEAMHVQSILSDAPTIIPADKETPCEDCPYDECSIPEIGSCEVADKES